MEPLETEITYKDFKRLEVETGRSKNGEYWIDLRTYSGQVLISLGGFATESEATQALNDELYKVD